MKNLAIAICKVKAAVSHVQKTGKNSFHGYNYASDEDLVNAYRKPMADAGLVMIPTQVAQSDKQLDKGKVQTDVHIEYTLVHTSGESITMQAVGRGIDKEDKGPYKAITGARKYALRQIFLAPTGDDPEAHSSIHESVSVDALPQKAQVKKREAPAQRQASSNDDRKESGDVPSCPK